MMKKLILALALFLTSVPVMAQEATKESAFDRVMRTSTLHCGYATWPPFFEKDVNTGAFSGLMVDLMSEMGKQLSLKIEWTEEVSWAALFEGYKTGRIDMICGPIVPTPGRARASDFTKPFAYYPNYLYAKAGDTRFDHNFSAANKPDIKIAIMEGELSQIIADEDFPQAQKVSMMSLTDNSSMMLALATGKADIAATEPVGPSNYMKNNPNQIRRVEGGAVRILPIAFSLPQGEEKLRRMMDITLDSLHDTGFIDKIFKKYLPPEDDFPRVAKPYKESK